LGRYAVQILAAAGLAALLWTLLRLALGLRQAKVAREETRRTEEGQGRRVVAEIPLANDRLVLFLEDDQAFYWAGLTARKHDLLGARLTLNGGVMATVSRPGHALPEPSTPEEFEGRERWEVVLYTAAGGPLAVPCGSLREGVSREAATRVFESVRAALQQGREGSGEGGSHG
jgi:hypothetical protein